MLGAPSLGLRIQFRVVHCIIRRATRCPARAHPRRRLCSSTANHRGPKAAHAKPQQDLEVLTPIPRELPPTPLPDRINARKYQTDKALEWERNKAHELQKRPIGREHPRPIGHTFSLVHHHHHGRRAELLRTIAKSSSSENAYEAYREASQLPFEPTKDDPHVIPFSHFHRLARLLSIAQPRTRALFLKIVEVLSALKEQGGRLQVWEWNMLVECAGKGWRKTRPEDYKAALGVYEDWVAHISPNRTTGEADPVARLEDEDAIPKPDIGTYTTLLYIAARTLLPATLRHASSLLQASGLPPNIATHTTILRYYSRVGQLSGVRSTLTRVREHNLALDIVLVNACMEAYARNGRVDVASTIYRVLRHHVVPETEVRDFDIKEAIKYLETVEGIVIPENMIPDRVSYTLMLQGFAYTGDLIRALQVFSNMLSSSDLEPFAPRVPDEYGELQHVNYPTTLPVFRALFLGFARHSQEFREDECNDLLSRLERLKLKDSPWTLANLQSVFDSFLELPPDTKPSDRTIWWLLVAYAKLTGNNLTSLHHVLSRIESRFGRRKWRGRMFRIKQKIKGEIPGGVATEVADLNKHVKYDEKWGGDNVL